MKIKELVKNKKLIFTIILFFLFVLLCIVICVFLVINRGNKIFDSDIIESSSDTAAATQDCIYNGVTYSSGELFESTDEFNQCVCGRGRTVCTEVNCEEPSIIENQYEVINEVNPENTNALKTYSSPNFSIEFDYPARFGVKEESNSMGAYIISIVTDDSDIPTLVEIYDNDNWDSEKISEAFIENYDINTLLRSEITIAEDNYRLQNFSFGEGVSQKDNPECLYSYNYFLQVVGFPPAPKGESWSGLYVIGIFSYESFVDCNGEIADYTSTEEDLKAAYNIIESIKYKD